MYYARKDLRLQYFGALSLMQIQSLYDQMHDLEIAKVVYIFVGPLDTMTHMYRVDIFCEEHCADLVIDSFTDGCMSKVALRKQLVRARSEHVAFDAWLATHGTKIKKRIDQMKCERGNDLRLTFQELGVYVDQRLGLYVRGIIDAIDLYEPRISGYMTIQRVLDPMGLTLKNILHEGMSLQQHIDEMSIIG